MNACANTGNFELGVHALTKITIICSIVLLFYSSATATAGSLSWRPAGPYPTSSNCQPISFDQPDALAVNQSGDIYLANESGPYALQEITAQGAIHTLLDRRVEPIRSGHYFGLSLAINRSGIVFLAVEERRTVERLNPNGTLTLIAGRPGERLLEDGPASQARLKSPNALAIGPDAMYVADSRTIRRVSQDGSIRTLAGNPHARDPHPLSGGSPFVADGKGSRAVFMSPNGIAVDGRGTVYVADGYQGFVERQAADIGLIREVTPMGRVTTIAGTLNTIGGDADDHGAAATFDYVYGIAADIRGNFVVTEPFRPSVRRVDPNGLVSTISKGKFGMNFSTTGLIAPTGVAVGASGEIFVVENPSVAGPMAEHEYWLHRIIGEKLEVLCQISSTKN